MTIFKGICNLLLDDLSQQLKNLVIGEIWLNGNGSRYMRLTACAAVKETSREVTDQHIKLEVGINFDELKSKSEEIFVRVSVVLHGNLGGGSSGVLYTKPGQLTYKKHVTNKSMSTAKSVYQLPDEFAQGDVSIEITGLVSENVEKQANKYVSMFINGLKETLWKINIPAFVDVR